VAAVVDGQEEAPQESLLLSMIRSQFPCLSAWLAATMARESVAKTFHEEEVMQVMKRARVTWSGADNHSKGVHESSGVTTKIISRKERMEQASDKIQDLFTRKRGKDEQMDSEFIIVNWV
jgi:hypothetical protein